MTGSRGDDRAVSEGAGVAALVLLTVLVTASVGVSVLFVDQSSESGVNASFSFQYFDSRASVLVSYDSGIPLNATDVTLATPVKNITWAEVAGLNDTAKIRPGSAVQLNPNNRYGGRISSGTNVTILYNQSGNTTRLASYTAGN